MSKREPFIGITCDIHIPKKRPEAYELVCDHRYPEAVKLAGGYPILLPVAHRKNVIERYLDGVDGLIIVGGDDVDPRLYGEKPRKGHKPVFGPRLKFEKRLYQGALKRNLPIMGICYGMQLINVLEGGTLYQDVQRDAKTKWNHQNKKSPLHSVKIEPKSRLEKIIQSRSIPIHSDHHQAVSRVAPKFKPVAHAPDGIIEAIESRVRRILAVQWHPERTLRSISSQRLFRAFIEMCRS